MKSSWAAGWKYLLVFLKAIEQSAKIAGNRVAGNTRAEAVKQASE